jgi:hypothetical protein
MTDLNLLVVFAKVVEANTLSEATRRRPTIGFAGLSAPGKGGGDGRSVSNDYTCANPPSTNSSVPVM